MPPIQTQLNKIKVIEEELKVLKEFTENKKNESCPLLDLIGSEKSNEIVANTENLQKILLENEGSIKRNIFLIFNSDKDFSEDDKNFTKVNDKFIKNQLNKTKLEADKTQYRNDKTIWGQIKYIYFLTLCEKAAISNLAKFKLLVDIIDKNEKSNYIAILQEKFSNISKKTITFNDLGKIFDEKTENELKHSNNIGPKVVVVQPKSEVEKLTSTGEVLIENQPRVTLFDHYYMQLYQNPEEERKKTEDEIKKIESKIATTQTLADLTKELKQKIQDSEAQSSAHAKVSEQFDALKAQYEDLNNLSKKQDEKYKEVLTDKDTLIRKLLNNIDFLNTAIRDKNNELACTTKKISELEKEVLDFLSSLENNLIKIQSGKTSNITTQEFQTIYSLTPKINDSDDSDNNTNKNLDSSKAISLTERLKNLAHTVKEKFNSLEKQRNDLTAFIDTINEQDFEEPELQFDGILNTDINPQLITEDLHTLIENQYLLDDTIDQLAQKTNEVKQLQENSRAQVLELQNKLAEKTENIEKLNKEKNQLKENINTTNEDFEALKVEFQTTKESLTKSHGELDEANENLTKSTELSNKLKETKNELQTEIDTLKESSEKAAKNISTLNAVKENLSGDLEAARQALQQSEYEITRLKSEHIAEITASSSSNNETILELTQKINSLEELKVTQENSIKGLESKIQEKDKEILTAGSEISKLIAQEDIAVKKLEGKLNENLKQIHTLEESKQALTTQIKKLTSENKTLSLSASDAKESLENTNFLITQLQEELANLRTNDSSKLETAKKELENLKLNLESQITELQQKNTEHQEELDQFSIDDSNLKVDYAKLDKELSVKILELNKIQTELKSTKEQLEEARAKNIMQGWLTMPGTQTDLIDFENPMPNQDQAYPKVNFPDENGSSSGHSSRQSSSNSHTLSENINSLFNPLFSHNQNPSIEDEALQPNEHTETIKTTAEELVTKLSKKENLHALLKKASENLGELNLLAASKQKLQEQLEQQINQNSDLYFPDIHLNPILEKISNNIALSEEELREIPSELQYVDTAEEFVNGLRLKYPKLSSHYENKISDEIFKKSRLILRKNASPAINITLPDEVISDLTPELWLEKQLLLITGKPTKLEQIELEKDQKNLLNELDSALHLSTFYDIALTPKSITELKAEIEKSNHAQLAAARQANELFAEIENKQKEYLGISNDPAPEFLQKIEEETNTEILRFNPEGAKKLFSAIDTHLLKVGKWDYFNAKVFNYKLKDITNELLATIPNNDYEKDPIEKTIKYAIGFLCEKNSKDKLHKEQILKDIALCYASSKKLFTFNGEIANRKVKIENLFGLKDKKDRETQTTTGNPSAAFAGIFLPHNCTIIADSFDPNLEILANSEFKMLTDTFYANNAMQVGQTVTFEQKLSDNKSKEWSVTRDANSFAYNTSSWVDRLKNVGDRIRNKIDPFTSSQLSSKDQKVTYAAFQHAVASSKGPVLTLSIGANCSVKKEKYIRQLIEVFNQNSRINGQKTTIFIDDNHKLKIHKDAKTAMKNEIDIKNSPSKELGKAAKQSDEALNRHTTTLRGRG